VTPRASLAAARAVLDASPALTRQALVHLARAWDGLASAAGADRAAEVAGQIAAADADPAAPLPSRRQLRAHLARLERLARDRALAARHPDPRLRLVARRWPLLAVAAFAAALAIATALATRAPARPWRAAYFAGDGLTGRAVIRRERLVDVDWGRGRAIRGVGADWFSVRFESCLVIDRPTDAVFLLMSEDSSILYVGDRALVDNRGQHRVRVRGRSLALAPGRYPLRVDYQHQTGPASVSLLASLDGGAPRPIPSDRLRPPEACVSPR
jgi:hypothetical protein